tara:strand:+ start:1683 stop:2114 length:432 start_codon:yes stop_codon:yes gene_type:complete
MVIFKSLFARKESLIKKTLVVFIMDVLLDTSFILTALKEKLDIFQAEEFGDLILPEQVILELKKKALGNGKDNEKAKLGLDIIQKNKEKLKIINLDKKYVDAGIKRYAKKKKIIVATLDKELKTQLKGTSILTIRGKKKFALE